MNSKLQEYARNELKEGLSNLPEKWQEMFKRMYSYGTLNLSVNEIVDNIPEEKLDWAMQQVEKSIAKLSQSYKKGDR